MFVFFTSKQYYGQYYFIIFMTKSGSSEFIFSSTKITNI